MPLDTARLRDEISEREARAQTNGFHLRSIASFHRLLDPNRSPYRIGGTGEGDHRAVAGAFDHLASVRVGVVTDDLVMLAAQRIAGVVAQARPLLRRIDQVREQDRPRPSPQVHRRQA